MGEVAVVVTAVEETLLVVVVVAVVVVVVEVVKNAEKDEDGFAPSWTGLQKTDLMEERRSAEAPTESDCGLAARVLVECVEHVAHFLLPIAIQSTQIGLSFYEQRWKAGQ